MMLQKAFYLLVVTTIFISCSNNQKEESTKPVFKDISEFVYGSAEVVSVDRYKARSSNPGIIQEILVVKGENVAKGQPLFRIKATPLAENRLIDAQLNLKEVGDDVYGKKSRLESLKLELRRSIEQLQVDSLNYERRKRLWGKKIGSKSQLESAMLKHQASMSRVRTLKLDYQKIHDNLSTNYERAKSRVKTEKNALGELVVIAEIDGKILDIVKEVGEYLSPQEFLIEIGSSEFNVKINIDEVDISKVEIGDTAVLRLEAYPEEVFLSTISYISDLKDKSTQTFITDAILINRPKKLLNGLAGEANILVARRKSSLVIPSSYLMQGNKVLTHEGEIDVRVGVRDLEFVEILSSIDSTTLLLKPIY